MIDKRGLKKVHASNKFIEAGRAWTVPETKIFYIGLQRIKPQLNKSYKGYSKNLSFTINHSELSEVFNHKFTIKELDKLCMDLTYKMIRVRNTKELEDATNIRYIPVFKLLEYSSKEGLTIIFNDAMVDYLVLLADKDFTQIPYKIIFDLQSKHAIRLFEIMMMIRHKKHKDISYGINTFKEMLGIENQYKVLANLKDRVLEQAIKEINEKTPFCVNYEDIKHNRKVVGFKFTLYERDFSIDDFCYSVDKEEREKAEKRIQNCIKDFECMSALQLSPKEKALFEADIKKRFTNEEIQEAKYRIMTKGGELMK